MSSEVDLKPSIEAGMAEKVAIGILIVFTWLPSIVKVNSDFSMLATACLAVFIGCHGSVKPSPCSSHNKQTGQGSHILDDLHKETMSKELAIIIPFIASAGLLWHYFLVKLSYTSILTLIPILYVPFNVLVLSALFATVLPSQWNEGIIMWRLPLWKKHVEVKLFSKSELVAGVLGAGFYMWYVMVKHWLAHNMLGLAWAILVTKTASLGSFTNGAILLAGLFIYDVFWVFFTPVMDSAVKSSLDLPAVLLFPVGNLTDGIVSILGLGDIVIPGLFIALTLRFDMKRGWKKTYFTSALAGYTAGLLVAILFAKWFQVAQPALLYIVPGVIGFLGVHCAIRGEIMPLLAYDESEEYDGEEEYDEKEKEL